MIYLTRGYELLFCVRKISLGLGGGIQSVEERYWCFLKFSFLIKILHFLYFIVEWNGRKHAYIFVEVMDAICLLHEW